MEKVVDSKVRSSFNLPAYMQKMSARCRNMFASLLTELQIVLPSILGNFLGTCFNYVQVQYIILAHGMLLFSGVTVYRWAIFQVSHKGSSSILLEAKHLGFQACRTEDWSMWMARSHQQWFVHTVPSWQVPHELASICMSLRRIDNDIGFQQAANIWWVNMSHKFSVGLLKSQSVTRVFGFPRLMQKVTCRRKSSMRTPKRWFLCIATWTTKKLHICWSIPFCQIHSHTRPLWWVKRAMNTALGPRPVLLRSSLQVGNGSTGTRMVLHLSIAWPIPTVINMSWGKKYFTGKKKVTPPVTTIVTGPKHIAIDVSSLGTNKKSSGPYSSWRLCVLMISKLFFHGVKL